jgi:hypothetical protein
MVEVPVPTGSVRARQVPNIPTPVHDRGEYFTFWLVGNNKSLASQRVGETFSFSPADSLSHAQRESGFFLQARSSQTIGLAR